MATHTRCASTTPASSSSSSRDDAVRRRRAAATRPARTRREAMVHFLTGAPVLAHIARGTDAARAEEDVKTAYDGYASTYDDLDGGSAAKALGLDAMRADALRGASGDVLELAVGTGLNLASYDMAKINTFTAIDLSPGMLAQAKVRADALNFRRESSRFIEADATALPFEDASFDVVVDTFSLCVIENPVAALREVKRVLRPSGRAVLIEHSKSDVGPLGAYQDLTSKPVKSMSKGCVWNQDVEGLIRESGLKVVSVQRALLGLLVVVEATPS